MLAKCGATDLEHLVNLIVPQSVQDSQALKGDIDVYKEVNSV